MDDVDQIRLVERKPDSTHGDLAVEDCAEPLRY
jgi:hypothetical protein